MKQTVSGIIAVLLLALLAACSPAKVAEKKVVSVGYTLRIDGDTVFDKSPDGQPLEFLVGAGNMIPGFESAIMGMKVGEKKTFTVKSADAYGDRDETRVVDVPIDQFGTDKPEVGQQFSVQASGGVMVVTVTKVSAKSVTVDFNSPLAGKDLTFDVEIVKIRDATEDEISAGQSSSAPVAQ
jgi:FKBP-type peptidyl-prolyl cis-trans isomerase SlyD